MSIYSREEQRRAIAEKQAAARRAVARRQRAAQVDYSQCRHGIGGPHQHGNGFCPGPGQARCQVCGLRVEQGIDPRLRDVRNPAAAGWYHLATVAGREQERDHAAVAR